MEPSRQLLRDYGLALGLVVGALLIFWRTMLPQMQRNRVLDRAWVEQDDRTRVVQAQRRRLEALLEAQWDPLVVERMAREIFGDLGLPGDEITVPDGEGP